MTIFAATATPTMCRGIDRRGKPGQVGGCDRAAVERSAETRRKTLQTGISAKTLVAASTSGPEIMSFGAGGVDGVYVLEQAEIDNLGEIMRLKTGTGNA